MIAAEFLAARVTSGLGSLPHLDAVEAAAFVLENFDLPFCPSLPRRSPSESAITQALTGIRGVSLGQYGALAVHVGALDPEALVDTPIQTESYYGFRRFIEVLAKSDYSGPLQVRTVGPISIGIALIRSGAPPDLAFMVALQAASSHATDLGYHARRMLPAAELIMIIDEPFGRDIAHQHFPLAPIEAADMLSNVMATAQRYGTVGLRAGAGSDVSLMVEAGPTLLAVNLADADAGAAAVARFLRGGGIVAWGLTRTVGPIAESHGRARRRLAETWREMMRYGIAIEDLQAQSLVTPDGPLGVHSLAAVKQIVTNLRAVGRAARTPLASGVFINA